MTQQTIRIKLSQDTRAELERYREHLQHTLPSGRCSLGEAIRIAIVQGMSELRTLDHLTLEPYGTLDCAVSVVGASWLWAQLDVFAERFGVSRARVIREAITLGVTLETAPH